MLQRSGAADRDCGGYFPPIRDAFLRRGIAVYSLDKPGIGGSSGDWRRFALFDRTDQALAAIDALKEHVAIDPRRVGVRAPAAVNRGVACPDEWRVNRVSPRRSRCRRPGLQRWSARRTC
jgi:hypothetical protein